MNILVLSLRLSGVLLLCLVVKGDTGAQVTSKEAKEGRGVSGRKPLRRPRPIDRAGGFRCTAVEVVLS